MNPHRLTVHCSATPNGKDIGGAAAIDQWHKLRGFRGCGYHVVINPDGTVEDGQGGICRPLNVIGAHVHGENEGNIGICLIGTDKYSMTQWDRLYYHMHAMTQMYGVFPENFYVHNYFNRNKTCPGFTNQALLSWYCGPRWEAIKINVI